MNTTSLPKQLPFLPGNSYADPTITRYHKTQLLGVRDGHQTGKHNSKYLIMYHLEKTSSLQETVDQELLRSMRDGDPMKLTGAPARRPQENDAIPKIAPKWLKYDKQVKDIFKFKLIKVLSFNAYFQEPVVENPNENYRVRKCTVYYYLDDDTLHVLETRVENSGIPQGVFLKRHKVLVPGQEPKTYTWRDLNVGLNLNVYGRVFRIVDADDFTKRFYLNEGVALNAPEQYPEDPFQKTRAMMTMKQNPPDLAEHKNYIEVMLKGGRPNKNLESFIKSDRRVLSFNILWEDTTYDGGDKFYVLNFFLSDSSIEVKEINEPNNGKIPFPMLLKRKKLAKQPILTHYPGMSLRTEEFYLPADLTIGQRVHVFGRDCLIYDCDDFTREWFTEILGQRMDAIPLRKPRPTIQYQAIPPYNGYGTMEDSLGSIYALQPKPPKLDMKKMFKQDMHVMRFESKLISTEPDDEARRFIISFYCGDDTIQVYEVCDKNSGRIGGKFMERKKHHNPVNQKYYIEQNFLLGSTLFLGGFKFMLIKADEYTEKYQEDNQDLFPQASMSHVIAKIKRGANGYKSLQDYAIAMLSKLDKDGSHSLSFKEFTDGLRS